MGTILKTLMSTNEQFFFSTHLLNLLGEYKNNTIFIHSGHKSRLKQWSPIIFDKPRKLENGQFILVISLPCVSRYISTTLVRFLFYISMRISFINCWLYNGCSIIYIYCFRIPHSYFCILYLMGYVHIYTYVTIFTLHCYSDLQ